MQQIPLSDLLIPPGQLVEWIPAHPAHRAFAHCHATLNQRKYFAAAILARAEKAPGTSWIGVTFTIVGQLDEEALEKALNVFVHRHDVLRCTFELHEDGLRCHRIQDCDLMLQRADLGWFASCNALREFLQGCFNAEVSPLSWPLLRMGAVIAEAHGWFVNTMPIQFAVAGKNFAEVVAAAKTGFAESLASVDVPLVKAWKYLEPDTYRQRNWPYPVNFFSFLDFRKMPGAEQYRTWSPNTIVHLSHCNGGSIWLYRNDDGTFLHTVFAHTTLSRQSMNAYRKTIRQVLCDLIKEPNRTAMSLSFSDEVVMT